METAGVHMKLMLHIDVERIVHPRPHIGILVYHHEHFCFDTIVHCRFHHLLTLNIHCKCVPTSGV